MNSTALVTGGGRRIGQAIVRGLAEAGWDVALHYHGSQEGAEEMAAHVETLGRRCHLFQADFGVMEEVLGLIPRVFEQLPDCSLLVNNAAIFQRGRLLETDLDLFEHHFQINFRAPFFLTRDFARHCERGQVINILDTKITEELVNYFAYTLTKKALYAFTRMAAKELGPRIRVNGVAPGLILPPPGKGEAFLEKLGRRTPLGRHGEVKDVVDAVLFLAQSPFITGECLFVDGGEQLG